MASKGAHHGLSWGSLLLLIAGVMAPWCTGCGGTKPPPAAPTPAAPAMQPAPTPQRPPQTRPAAARRGTLYERMGGDAVVRAVVEDFVSRAASDPAVNFTRQGQAHAWEATPENVERLKQRLVEFVATTAGGPMQYRGADMVTAHRGMAITNAEFDALAGHLRAALDANDVPRRERDELLKAVGSMRGAVVEVADAPAPQPQDPSTTDAAPTPDAAPSEPAPEGAPKAKADDPAPVEAPEQPKPEDAPAPEAPPPEAPAPDAPAPDAPPAPADPAAPDSADPPKADSAAEPAPVQEAPSPSDPRH